MIQAEEAVLQVVPKSKSSRRTIKALSEEPDENDYIDAAEAVGNQIEQT